MIVLSVDGEGKAEPRCEVVAVRIHERAIVDRSVFGLDQRVGHRIVIGEEVVLLPLRRRELVAQPEVQRQPRIHLHVVLQVAEVHPLAQVGDERVDESNSAFRAPNMKSARL